MKTQPIDQFACTLPPEKRQSVYNGTKTTHEKRTKLLSAQFAEPAKLRRLAGEIKQHAIENLDTLLPMAEERLKAGCAVGDDAPVTLRFLIEDYVRHQRGHLAQLTSGVTSA